MLVRCHEIANSKHLQIHILARSSVCVTELMVDCKQDVAMLDKTQLG